jgi:Rhodopirellula transposase DDE domain
MNWRGRPLTSHEVVVETIAATTNKSGLSVQAALDTNTYPKGIKITDTQMRMFESTHLRRHDFHGEWNYDLSAHSHTAGSDITTHPGPRA